MTARWTVFFEPLDVLQFRDHRPFDMGEHAVARTVFPGPSTFRGALRTLVFRACGARFEDADEHFGVKEEWARAWVGGRTRPGSLALRGPLLAELTPGAAAPFEPFLHAPRDLVPHEEADPKDGRVRVSYGVAQGQDARGAGMPLLVRWTASHAGEAQGGLPWCAADATKAHGPGYLTTAAARAYFAAAGAVRLRGQPGPALAARPARLLQNEPRVGIARDGSTLAAEDGMFYVTEPFRTREGVGFAVDVVVPAEQAAEITDCMQRLHGAVAQLGGKAHRARVHVFAGPLVPDDLAPDKAPGGRKIWLQTALPLAARLPRTTLVVADRPVPIGGFDFAQRAPRSLTAALPPGTIIHLPEDASWPPPGLETRSGHGFALVSPALQPAPSTESESP
jgi:hypothetical protein